MVEDNKYFILFDKHHILNKEDVGKTSYSAYEVKEKLSKPFDTLEERDTYLAKLQQQYVHEVFIPGIVFGNQAHYIRTPKGYGGKEAVIQIPEQSQRFYDNKSIIDYQKN